MSRTWVVPPLEGRAVASAGRPTFSVLIAAYQAAEFVGDAVQSALRQTIRPHEVIVCDDGSTDQIDAALAPYLDRIVLLRQSNQGESAAKNAACVAATGDFVVILDADDVWAPERLEALGDLAEERPDLDVVTTDLWFEVDGVRQGRFYDAVPFPEAEQDAAALDRAFLLHPAVRRSLWLDANGFVSAMEPAADWHFYIRLALGGARFGLVDEPLASYRLRPGSMASDRPGALRARVRVLEDIAAGPGVPDHLTLAFDRSLAQKRRRAAQAEAEEAWRERSPGRRSAAMRLALAPGVGGTGRAKALAGAVFPGWARRRLLRRADTILSRTGAGSGG